MLPLLLDNGDEFIEIDEHSEGGYYYSIYPSREAFENGEEDIEGGVCTGSLSDALEMALTTR